MGGSLGLLNFQNLALKFSFKLADMQTLQDQNSILFETVKTFEISLFDRYDDQCSKPYQWVHLWSGTKSGVKFLQLAVSVSFVTLVEMTMVLRKFGYIANNIWQ